MGGQREILWDKRQIRSEEGNLYDAEYYLLVEEMKAGENLLCENYGVKLCVSGGPQLESLAVPGITVNAHQASALLDLLSRNMVTPVSFPDVLEDFLV